MTAHARPLATRLAAASDDELEALLRARRVRPDVDWEDFFDAAEALLEPASVERALSHLSRDEAIALLRAARDEDPGASAGTLAALGLLDAEGAVPPPVSALLANRSLPERDTPAPPSPAPDGSAARAAERALTTVGAVADLLLAARSSPLSLVATGALGAGEKRRLAEAGTDAGIVDDLRELAEEAGLVVARGRELQVTSAAEGWLSAPFAPRWAVLAEAFRVALPHGIRRGDGWAPMTEWGDAHPWDPAWPAAHQRLRRLAGLLGLVCDDGTEPEWARMLRSGAPADTSSLSALLPTEVDRVFLQNDLTAIAPGPLQPALDNRLRAMTEHESAAQASSYRFTAESVARALVDGETQNGILEFLSSISLTGVPQPLEYLVMQAAARHGLVRVRADESAGTVVSSSDRHLLQAIEVDRALRPLGLVREGAELVSRVAAETVSWALADAHYPATLVDRDGRPVPARRRRVADAAPVERVSYAALIARLRARQGPDADAAWLDRELDAAVRARALVRVTVAMPDGTSRELTLEATGLGGGRLRGRDKAADVERTLPVRSIRSVTLLEH